MGKSKSQPPPSTPPPVYTVVVYNSKMEIVFSGDANFGSGGWELLNRFILQFMETKWGRGGGKSHAIFPDGQPIRHPPRKRPVKGKKKKDDE